jgi:shikimate 5-dehydrogenase
LGMLLHQGAKAFEIWTGQPFPIPLIRARLLQALTDQPIVRSPPSKE